MLRLVAASMVGWIVHADESSIRLAETALRDSEERIRGILRTAVEGIITIDERGVIDSINPAAEKLFGWRADELIGRDVACLCPRHIARSMTPTSRIIFAQAERRLSASGAKSSASEKTARFFPWIYRSAKCALPTAGFLPELCATSRSGRGWKEILEISDREQRRIGQDLHDDLCQTLAGIELMSEALEKTCREIAAGIRAGRAYGRARAARDRANADAGARTVAAGNGVDGFNGGAE